MMEGVITAGTGTAANIGRTAAGKTGTSQSYRDAWFVGFTPDLLTAVWVGADDDRPMAGVTGGEIPAHIWRTFMSVAEKGRPPLDFSWLVPEPTASPDTDLAAQSGAYSDEPPVMEGAAVDPQPGPGSLQIEGPRGSRAVRSGYADEPPAEDAPASGAGPDRGADDPGDAYERGGPRHYGPPPDEPAADGNPRRRGSGPPAGDDGPPDGR